MNVESNDKIPGMDANFLTESGIPYFIILVDKYLLNMDLRS